MPATESLVGRDSELQRLREVVGGPGMPGIVFLEGEAGVGETTVLEAVAAEAAAAGSRVLWARPTPAETSSSYAALDDLVRPALEGLPRLPEPQRRALAVALLMETSAAPVEPRLVGSACLALLGAVSGPLLLAVDDWQWLDAASAAVLTFVMRRLEPGGAKLLATLRSGEADADVAELLRRLPQGRAAELEVGPLDVPALARLVEARTGRRMALPALERLHAACGGNALFALELIRAPDERHSTDVRRLLGRRLGALSPDARAVLRVAAAFGEPSPEAVEAAMAAGPGAGRGLEEALAADVLVRRERRLRFSHPLLAAVVEERTPPSDGGRSTPGSRSSPRTTRSAPGTSLSPPTRRRRTSPPRSSAARGTRPHAAPRSPSPSSPSARPRSRRRGTG